MRYVHSVCVSAVWCGVVCLPGFTTGAERAIGVGEAAKPGTGGHRWAFVVGVNKYVHVPTLRYPVADARLLHRILCERAAFEQDRTLLLTDDQADLKDKPIRSNILDQLAAFLAFPGKGDTVLVFFSGHGFKDDQGRGYLAPQDAKKTNLALTCVPIAEVKRLLEACKARQKVLILDTCHSGTARGGPVDKGITVDAGKLVEQAAGKGFVTLASCGPDQESQESEELGHGVFSYFLAEGLQGRADRDRDGWIDFDELYRYAWDKTRLYVMREYRRKQEPLKDVRVQGVMVLARAGSSPAARPRPPRVDPARPVRPTMPARPAPAPQPGNTITNSIGMKLVYIRPGTFTMGSPPFEEKRAHDESQHRVTIAKGFYMGAHEVTNGQYRQFKSDHKSGVYKGNSLNGDDQPVVNVSWHDAVAFCKWLSQKEGRTYRLPTEAEWECACGAGTETSYSWGNLFVPSRCNFADKNADLPRADRQGHDGYAVTAPVGSYEPNAWGFYDMHGNVWEWCEDWYAKDYWAQSPGGDPIGPFGGARWRVLRGGGWVNFPLYCRTANPSGSPPSYRRSYIGFRCVSPRLSE